MNEDVKKIRIEDYTYELPDERIARFPLAQRDASKLLIAKRGENFTHLSFRAIESVLPADTHLIFNETKVVQARLLFAKNETTSIEVFCLEPLPGTDIQQAMATKKSIEYLCLVGGARKWKSGFLRINLGSGGTLQAEKMENCNGTFRIAFSWDSELTFAEVLETAGRTPLPPYLKRVAEASDRDRYQTVFARHDGSVAAPTASLHFTPQLVQKLEAKGIHHSNLTLHVGAGTFKPVESEDIGSHEMHAEEIFIKRSFVQDIRQRLDKRIIPVGTTAMRALESLYWFGALLHVGERPGDETIPLLDQWTPYRTDLEGISVEESLQALEYYLIHKQQETLQLKTAIIIAPGYRHQLCGGLLTNFHQPKSTLLLLVASLLGDRWKEMYRYALEHDFRFLSYGDACLILS
ncbi:MAG: S-adenosylmethionine tRNA ribosyltransferase [Owenweeksia sp.]|nr:S-adenosylmethionine tRNA ribosyltransferase [Owenweeksia sp.]MBF99823.1 S-adenosylmethionine tRNA ribosyltransferase [Owenweeksia sp.]HBF20219.1 S-adenosylmethionine tRNA ribosyltransferase [Cryomorphaceae bacterium]HCQ17359.1 S-adenosylmethionine tRNA ribosyltransferase [Cryomorphaceae bacterium]